MSEDKYLEDEWQAHLDAVRERELDLTRERGGFRGPDPKPAPRLKRKDAPRASETWKVAVLERDQGCCVHPNPADCAEGWQAHHVVAQQELRRMHPEALWNPLSGMGLCGLAHRQHHSRARPVRLAEIPAEVEAYLLDLGYWSYLNRHYALPGRPVNLDAT